MCGRMNVSDQQGVQALLVTLGLHLSAERFAPRYNVAPGMAVWTAFGAEAFELAEMHWGIVPSWAGPEKFSRPLINARAETVWDKPSFRNLIRSSRALVPANGFYEWQRAGGTRIPYYIHPPGGGAFAFAGLYQVSREGELQCCILTTVANDAMRPIHARMPVIIAPEAMADWLGSTDRARLDSLMQPVPAAAIETARVSPYVNNARNEGPRCIETVAS
jgi:putative SOS response-associated peptidase YedK